MGKDKKLQTGSRYILCAKIARIHSKKESGKELTELFVETSQSSSTAIPILIATLKENFENTDFIWTWIQEIWEKDLKCFIVRFDNRDITVHFPKPKIIGDGKLFLNLLYLKAAYQFFFFMDCFYI